MSLKIQFKFPNKTSVTYKLRGNKAYQIAQTCLAEDGKTTLANLLWNDNYIDESEFVTKVYQCIIVLQDDTKYRGLDKEAHIAYKSLLEFTKNVLSTFVTADIDTELKITF